MKLDCCEVDPPLPVLGAVLMQVLLGGGDEVVPLPGGDGLFRQAHGRAGAGADLDEYDCAAALRYKVDLARACPEVGVDDRIPEGFEAGSGQSLAPASQILPGPAHGVSSMRRGWMKGEKVMRWMGQGPSSSTALRWSGVA